jgi:hypothetical protein
LADDPLSREFSLERDINVPYTLHLCIFKINRVLQLPFLEFYLEKGAGEYEFPHIVLSEELFKHLVENEESRIEPVNEEGLEEKGDEDADEIFMNKCFIFLKEKIGDVENLETMYNGFVEKEGHIFAVFGDLSDIDTASLTGGIWSTLDEILNKKSVSNVPVSPMTGDIFLENRVLANIKNEEGENLPLPTVLYLCNSIEDSLYQNTYYKSGESSLTHTTMIHERVEHPKLKYVYLFSETILPADEFNSEIKRYALYIDPENKLQSESDEIPEVPVVGFQENGIDYWSTKSPKYFAEVV